MGKTFKGLDPDLDLTMPNIELFLSFYHILQGTLKFHVSDFNWLLFEISCKTNTHTNTHTDTDEYFIVAFCKNATLYIVTNSNFKLNYCSKIILLHQTLI